MSKDPYFRTFPSNFLGGIVDLKADEIGAYWVVILLMHDRGGPIPDDREWIARRAGLSRRRWDAVRKKLIAMGKLKCRNGELANPRALRDIEKRLRLSDVRRAAALARWHGEDSPELDLGDEIGESGDNDLIEREPRNSAISDDANASEPDPPASDAKPQPKRTDSAKKASVSVPGINEQERLNSADPDDAIASKDSRARSRPRVQSPDSTRTNAEPPPPRALARDPDPPDLDALLKRVSEASGFWPSAEGHRAKALEFVDDWVRLGIDIESTAIPVIERIIAAAPDKTTGSLARFDRYVRAEHAAARAREKHPPPPAPPSEPAGTDDDDPRLELIRKDLCADLGARTYQSWLMPAVLTIEGSILIVTLPSAFMADWVLSHFANRFRGEAKRHGFTEVRIGASKPP